VSVDGLLNLYKPAGPSSARFVYRLRPILGERRIGHAGALDPFAEGVLLACCGRATRLVERLMALEKTYDAGLVLGVTNDTFDPEQPFRPVSGAADPGQVALRRAVDALIGEIDQVPPEFSALKIDGRPAYERARRARSDAASPPTAMAPRRVRIAAIEVRRYAWPEVDLTIRCGRGTYIRAIARDLGQALGCGACCQSVLRRSVGPFVVADALRLERASAGAARAALRSIDAVQALLDQAG
jgi:tRNA pseudouridine55 synthase